MTYFHKICILTALAALSASGCTGADSHADDAAQLADRAEDSHAQNSQDHGSHDESSAVDYSQYGHMSAIYICGNDELQTTHTDAETKLAYKGQKIDVERTVSIVDNAFAGESFRGEFNGQSLYFRGKGHDVSLEVGDEVISCEKISCIPLGGPH